MTATAGGRTLTRKISSSVTGHRVKPRVISAEHFVGIDMTMLVYNEYGQA